MAGGGHASLPSVLLTDLKNFVGVGGDDHIGKKGGFCDGFVDSPNQGHTVDGSKSFASEAGRCESRGDDGNCLHRRATVSGLGSEICNSLSMWFRCCGVE